MRTLTLGIILALGLCGCESKGTSCRSNGVESCSCVAESMFPDDNTCGPAADTDSVCCAEPTWPKTGTCVCRSFYCAADSETECHCRSQVAPDGGTPIAKCTGTHCCLATTALGLKFECTCGEAECAEGTTEVSECKPASLAISAFCGLLAPGDGGMPGATVASTCR